jgi:hypothetical protein
MERKLQEFAQGFQVPRIIAVRHNPPLWGPGGWELETKGLNPDVGNILVTWTSSFFDQLDPAYYDCLWGCVLAGSYWKEEVHSSHPRPTVPQAQSLH